VEHIRGHFTDIPVAAVKLGKYKMYWFQLYQ